MELDEFGTHPVQCARGGWVVRRHNDVVRYLAERFRTDLGAQTGGAARTQLDRTTPDGGPIESRLDLVVTYHGRTTWLDAVVTDPWCSDPSTRRARLNRDGAAAEAAEQTKRRRYGLEAVPFALETGGRWGELAIAWWSRLYHEQPPDVKGSFRRGLAATLHSSIACAIQAAL